VKDSRPELKVSQQPLSLGDFLASYNQNIPAGFPRASVDLLKKFREANTNLFKHEEHWTLDLHRKKLMDWLLRQA
jgi:hypothetical protein